MITVRNARKVYGTKVAVDNLSFDVKPGAVTGFLGPNGAGKSTTLRLMLGLDHGEGETLFDGRAYDEIVEPWRHIGAVLDAKAIHPHRTARNHLRMLAAASSIPFSRADEVLEEVGLTSVADKKPGGFSLGMGQRLGLAGALLGRPKHLILDEPGNGLDPQGIHWLRDFLKHYAQADRTVFVSSHLLSEMNLMADRLVVIGKGKTLHYGDVASFVNRFSDTNIVVRSSRLPELIGLLRTFGARDTPSGDGAAIVTGIDPARIGEVAAQHGIVVHELTVNSASLEDAFLHATGDQAEFTKVGSGSISITPKAMPSAPTTTVPTATPATTVPTATPATTAPTPMAPTHATHPHASDALAAHVQTPPTAAVPVAAAASQGPPVSPEAQAAEAYLAHMQQAAAAQQAAAQEAAAQQAAAAAAAAQAAAASPQMPVAQLHTEALQAAAAAEQARLRGEEPSPWHQDLDMETLGYRAGHNTGKALTAQDSAESPLYADTSRQGKPAPGPRRESLPAGRSRYDYDYGAKAHFYPPGPQRPSGQNTADSARTVGAHDEASETWLTSGGRSRRGSHAAPPTPATPQANPAHNAAPRESAALHLEWDLGTPAQPNTAPRPTPPPRGAHSPTQPVRYDPHRQNSDPRGWLDPTRAPAQPTPKSPPPATQPPATQPAQTTGKTRRELRAAARRQAEQDPRSGGPA